MDGWMDVWMDGWMDGTGAQLSNEERIDEGFFREDLGVRSRG